MIGGYSSTKIVFASLPQVGGRGVPGRGVGTSLRSLVLVCLCSVILHTKYSLPPLVAHCVSSAFPR